MWLTVLGDYPYGEGSSSSDDAKSSISESTEPGLDLSSDDEEDDDDDDEVFLLLSSRLCDYKSLLVHANCR